MCTINIANIDIQGKLDLQAGATVSDGADRKLRKFSDNRKFDFLR